MDEKQIPETGGCFNVSTTDKVAGRITVTKKLDSKKKR